MCEVNPTVEVHFPQYWIFVMDYWQLYTAILLMHNLAFLHDRPWISPWIKSISNEISFSTWSRHNCLVIVTSSALDCDVISRTWIEQVSHGDGVWRSSFLSSFMGSLCRVGNKIMYVLSWQTVYALTRVLFWCLFPSLLRNSGNKHQNNPLVSA